MVEFELNAGLLDDEDNVLYQGTQSALASATDSTGERSSNWFQFYLLNS